MARRDVCIPCLAVLAWTLLLGVLFGIQYTSERQSTQTMMVQAAKGIFQQVVLTREWNTQYGGVYVPVAGDSQPNPYLPDDRRTLTTTDGQMLARVNPAFMTRQISEIAARRDGVNLRITSLNPLRPENAPTPWEARALADFEEDKPEVQGIEATASGPVFRYMAPLEVTEACLPCHAKQGYKLGEVRGGISISLPAGHFLAAQSAAIGGTAGLYALIWLVGGVCTGLGTATILDGKTKAEAANRAKTTFLAILSHELRTPLNGVLGMLEILSATPLDDEQHSLVDDAQSAALAMNAQVQELLELAGLESGQVVLQNTRFCPVQVIEEALAPQAQAARCKGLAFALYPAPDLPAELFGDGVRLGRIVAIVADNAVKFTASGRVTVTVSAGCAAGACRLTVVVADTGCGIDPERLSAIFEPFFQVEDVLTRRKPGLGAGLTIARKHADILGATLTCHSLPGRGATFTITAPFRQVV
jgi:signal transduction histidine kinase